MPVNADKPHLWKGDVRRSVDFYNDWFMRFAPKAYRDTRVETTAQVESALSATTNLTRISAAVLREHPAVLPILRMATAPPIARDRLIGLAGVPASLVRGMELHQRVTAAATDADLARIAETLIRLLDRDIFPWLNGSRRVSRADVHRAATIIADRLCGSLADPIIRNAQERLGLGAPY